MSTTETTTTLADKAKGLCAMIQLSDLDDSVKATLTKAALDATYRYADTEEAMKQVAYAQRTVDHNKSTGYSVAHGLEMLAVNARKAADSYREAETKYMHALDMWNALRD